MNWLDIVIIICIIIGIVQGLFSGIIKQVISLLSLVLAVLLAGRGADIMRNFADKYIHFENPLSPAVTNLIYYIIAFILIIVVFSIVGGLVNKAVNFTPANILNKIAGALFGGILWIICLSFILNVFAVFDSESRIISKQTQEKSVYYNKTKEIFPFVFPYIKDFFKS